MTGGTKPKRILLVAGEVSGDLHGAHLMEAVRQIEPGIQFFGIGGEHLKKGGMELLYHCHSLSVVGITEAVRRIAPVLRALRGVKRALDRQRPDLVILIDFPEFNLRVAKRAHRRGIPVVYYISPQVWAWRSNRVKSIARWVRKMIVLLPFEVPLYEEAGVDVDWVGHPLLDIVRPTLSKEEGLRQFGLDPLRRTVALLPGSRSHEVKRLLPSLLASANLLRDEIPDLQFVIPLAPSIPKTMLSGALKKASLPVTVVEGLTYDVMNLSELLITASGTATLEAAILGKPMVIVYKVSSLSYWIGRALIEVEHIGLVNLIAAQELAPELIQDDANPRRIAEEALRILRNPILQRSITESMAEVRQNLGEPGAPRRAAEIIVSLLHEGE
jgi:lipid-A-disaccharide synthase